MLFNKLCEFFTIFIVRVPYDFINNRSFDIWKLIKQFLKIFMRNDTKITIWWSLNSKRRNRVKSNLNISYKNSILEFAKKHSLSWIVVFVDICGSSTFDHYFPKIWLKLLHDLKFRLIVSDLNFGKQEVYFCVFVFEWKNFV